MLLGIDFSKKSVFYPFRGLYIYIYIYQSEGARTAYFIPERVGEGEAAATESTLFVCLCVCPAGGSPEARSAKKRRPQKIIMATIVFGPQS